MTSRGTYQSKKITKVCVWSRILWVEGDIKEGDSKCQGGGFWQTGGAMRENIRFLCDDKKNADKGSPCILETIARPKMDP